MFLQNTKKQVLDQGLIELNHKITLTMITMKSKKKTPATLKDQVLDLSHVLSIFS